MKTLVFDIDDTLTTDGSWERLNAAAGVTPEEDYGLYTAFVNGEIDYKTWINKLETIYHDHNPLTRTLAESVLNNFTLRDGVTEVMQQLKSDGYIIVLLSGGFRVMVETVAQLCDADIAVALSDIAYTDNDTFDHFISSGEEGQAKLQALKNYCAKMQINLTDCVTVGDSINDTPLFDLTGNGVTFSWCKPNIQAHAKHIIDDIRDFPALLDIL